MVQCGNVTAKPALRIPIQKISCDPLHISAGVINHLLNAIRAAIRAQLDANTELLRVARQAVKELEQMLKRLALSDTGGNKINPTNDDVTIDELARHAAETPILLPIHKDNIRIWHTIAKMENMRDDVMLERNLWQ